MHPEKQYIPIDSKEEGIDICFSDEHSEKAKFPKEVIVDEIVIWVSVEQLLKKLLGISFILPIISSVLIPLKIFFPNEIEEDEKVICFIDEHSLKAPSPIFVTEEGIITWSKEEHLLKE